MRSAFSLENDAWLDKELKFGQLLNEFLTLHNGRLRSATRLFDFVFHRMADGQRQLEVCRQAHSLVRGIIAQRRDRLHEIERGEVARPVDGEDRHKCIIDILLTTKDESGEGLTDEDIVYESNLFLFAGSDTSSITFQWLFYFLALHEEHQAKCREEIDNAFRGLPSLDDDGLAGLTYTTQCIKETLRMRPPVMATAIKLDEDIVIDGHTVPDGAMVWIEISAVHRNPEFWEKPDSFHPGHFDPESVQKRHPSAFIPFVGGPRRCLGELFAMEEMKTVTAYVLRHFLVRLADHQEVVPDIKDILCRPRHGVKLVLTPR